MLPPGVGVDELSLGSVLGKIAHESHCFRHRPTDDAADVGRQEQRLATGRRVGPHQAMAHRSKLHTFLRGEIRKAELAAGEQQRVLGDQILDLGLDLGVERIVGGAHIRKLGIATSGRNDAADSNEYFADTDLNENPNATADCRD